MNRFLLVPFVIACAAFTAWCWMNRGVSDASGESENRNILPVADYESTPVDATLSIEAVRSTLLDKWGVAADEHQDDRYRFSRALTSRENQYVNRPSIEFNESEALPEHLAMGCFRLERKHETLEFPLMVNRNSGQTSVYADRQWHDFDEWLVSRKGIF